MSVLALVMASLLGSEVLAVAAAGLLLASLMALGSPRHRGVVARWHVGLHVALAWWLGALVLTSWDGLSVGMGILAGVGTCLRVRVEQPTALPRRMGTALMWAGLVGLFLVTQQPLAAALTAIAALAEGACAFRPEAHRTPTNGASLSVLAWVAGMTVASVASGYLR